jgi:two-component system, OmpR family, sensor kinase
VAARRSRWVALAAVDFEAFDATVGDATRNLVIAGLVFAGAAGFGSYGLARAALSPVERLRREVAALSERDQAHPDPGAGVQVPRTRHTNLDKTRSRVPRQPHLTGFGPGS